ncbi:unnamed protein product, partial [Rotaria sp. Silwood1]
IVKKDEEDVTLVVPDLDCDWVTAVPNNSTEKKDLRRLSRNP